MLIQSVHFLTVCSSFPRQNPNRHSPLSSSSSSSLHPPLLIRFRPSRRQNLQHLKTLGIIPPYTKPPPPEIVSKILSIANYLKSMGFSDSQFPRLSFLTPQIFLSDVADIAAVFAFMSDDLAASPQESIALIHRCPDLLLTSADDCLRPTLAFLRDLGIKNLNSPTSLNAHLLNLRVGKLQEKIRFLESLGLSREEARRVCARLPAIFGYSVENNLMPKFEFLTDVMGRTIEELKGFPQYFAFSLEKRILPRHLHLKERGVKVTLQRMLLWSDQRFYAKWK
ncbi:transcription termination factor MTEF1, chloroplastic [Cinnamomum micranthum f. kanehirae]|uniref:Transcription termination factor MTEF1, chloroplastic n=1 Tax=Cinnamomum micranthum f. kanehirae TaxID=337451 RepID=A0A443N1G1_9MAGN|nr:transcription termination factor MTEF1, chloroplastic [Cinnamomum micranthum f. kanehirae]